MFLSSFKSKFYPSLSDSQVVTTLKNTAKPITEVKFPAVAICASGFHMSNVERKIKMNFLKWRNETERRGNDEAEIRADFEEYMRATFQIKPPKDGEEPANIMDILDTMVASNVEDSVTANAVRENVIACDSAKEAKSTGSGRRKRSSESCCQQILIERKEHLPGLSLEQNNTIEEWEGTYNLTDKNETHVMYKKDNNRILYVRKTEISTCRIRIDYESWCYAESADGSTRCQDNTDQGSLTKVDFFEGNRILAKQHPDYEKDLCEIPPPDTARYNYQFPTSTSFPTDSKSTLKMSCLDNAATIKSSSNEQRRAPVTISLKIEGLQDLTENAYYEHYDESSPDSDLPGKEQQTEWIGDYGHHDTLENEVWVYKKKDNPQERYIYFSGEGPGEAVYFESRCRPGNYWGCREEDDRPIGQVPLFNGTMSMSGAAHIMSYSYNRWFGRQGSHGKGCVFGEGDKRGYNSPESYPTPNLTITPVMPTTTTISTDLAPGSTSELEDAAVEDSLQSKCIRTSQNNSNIASSSADTPGIDIFLNPERTNEKNLIAGTKKKTAIHYFNVSDMTKLYPELFDILWDSTLPCFQNKRETSDHMLLSCQLGGKNVNCSNLFKRVPTDTGMCCALNNVDSLEDSEYKDLVHKHQGDTKTQTVNSTVGRRNGLRLTLDLHSNLVSFGTLGQEYDAFNVFIGQPEEFPMIKEKSLQLQPGREHFIDLSARVVSTKDIKNIAPEARECYFNDEGDLEFYEKYTYSNCRLEYASKKSEIIYGCVPWHLPRVRINGLV